MWCDSTRPVPYSSVLPVDHMSSYLVKLTCCYSFLCCFSSPLVFFHLQSGVLCLCWSGLESLELLPHTRVSFSEWKLLDFVQYGNDSWNFVVIILPSIFLCLSVFFGLSMNDWGSSYNLDTSMEEISQLTKVSIYLWILI